MKKEPLYQIIINDIKHDIVSGNYQVDDQLPTELELSQKYKVSRITSKRALVELENAGFVYRKRGKGTFVRALTSKNAGNESKDILFILPFPEDHSLGNYAAGIIQCLAESDYRLVIQSHESVLQSGFQQLIQQYAGVIFYPMNPSMDLELLYTLYLHQFPTVVLDKKYEDISFPTVVSDNQQGGYEATRHLLDSGLKKIAYVSGQSIMELSTTRERYLGYLKALYEGNKQEKILYENTQKEAIDGFISQVVERAIKEKVDGFVAENDIIAILLVNYLNQIGKKIPEEFSVIGFDNIQASSLIHPKLTTIEQNFTQMGQIACEKLIQEIQNPRQIKETLTVPIRLIQRETTR